METEGRLLGAEDLPVGFVDTLGEWLGMEEGLVDTVGSSLRFTLGLLETVGLVDGVGDGCLLVEGR